MYDTTYKCRYHQDNVFLDTDNITDDEKYYIRDILYKEDLLNIFDMDEEDSFDNLNKYLSNLYNKIYFSNDLRECMREAAAAILSENEELGLCLLFSYDLMYLTHLCISDYLETGQINENTIRLLKEKIKK